MYINFISKNLKLIIKLKQKPINTAIITAIKKAGLKQKFTNTSTAIISQKTNLKAKYINLISVTKTKA